MRWPLRNQVFVRILLLLVITIAAITYANIRSTLVENHTRELARVDEIGAVFTSTRFPLNNMVLESMSSLSGAQFVVSDQNKTTLAKTEGAPKINFEQQSSENSDHARTISIDRQDYLYSAVSTLNSAGSRGSSTSKIHIFVPMEDRWTVFWKVSKSPLLVAVVALPISLLISLALASQVTRPLALLRTQVQEIAKGNIQQINTPSRNDEIRDLHLSINEMAVKLQDHDNRVRQNERLQTLLKIGSSLAHNLRNSATGCKLAIEYLASEHQQIKDSENIEVAKRQLGLMESYIHKFMSLARPESDIQTGVATEVDLSKMMDKVLFLVSPSAAHLNVELVAEKPDEPISGILREDDAEQLMTNLILNAVAAASEQAVSENQTGRVEVKLEKNKENQVTLTVADNGKGPPDAIAKDLFEPFVSGRSEGTGLGLSLVKEIADRTDGDIDWTRSGDHTIFTFVFNSENTTS